MAPPPPSASQPLGQRLMVLAQTLQFGWFIGHLALLMATLRYFLSYITFNFASTWAMLSYRTVFVSAAFTYGIVVYKANKSRFRGGSSSRSPPQQTAVAILGDENMQYLLMALVWLLSKQIPLAILPFAVYSLFHTLTYTRTNLIPAIQPPQPMAAAASATSPTSPSSKPVMKSNAVADSIGSFVKSRYDSSMYLVAFLEVALWFRLLGSALLFQRGSWILMVVYTAFMRARFSQSQFVQTHLRQLVARVDGLLQNQGTPPIAQQIWSQVRMGSWKFAEATDLSRFIGSSKPAPAVTRKAQ